MTTQIDDNLVSRLKKISELFSILIVIIGFLVLIGWAFDISIFKSPGIGFQTIKSNVGLCFFFIGISLWLMQSRRINPRTRRIVQILAFIITLIGFLTLLEYLFKLNIGIDQMLFTEAPGALQTSTPNRMGINSTLNLILAGLALLVLDLKIPGEFRPAQFFVIIGFFISILALVGYGYGASFLYYLPNYTGIAIYAAITFILIFMAILFARPDKGLMITLISKDLGGIILRRLLPAIIIIPLIFGWLLGVGESLGLYNVEFGHALFAVSTMVFLSVLLWSTAISINNLDSKRRALEEVLKKNEEKFRTVADFTYNWEFWVGPDGNLKYVSPSCERISGYRPEEFIEHDDLLYEITHPDDLEKLMKHRKDEMETKHPIEFELRIIHRDGEERWIRHVCQPIYGDEGVFLGRRVSHQDITERKKAEEELKLSNRYNRSLIEASLDPLVTIGPEGKITDVNNATEKVTGYSRDKLIETDFSNYFTQPEKAREGYEQVFKDGYVRDYPLKIQHKNGQTTPVLYNATTYKDETGQIIGIFAAARDITQLKKAEQVLKKHKEILEMTVKERTEELEKTNEVLEAEIKEHQKAEEKLKEVVEELTRSNKDLEQFAYIASHDLQEPLRSVSGFLQLLSRRYHGKLDPKADQYIDIAVGGAGRMQTMIEDLLKFSRVTTRGEKFKPTNFEKLLSDVSLDLKTIIEENNAIITHDPLPTVMADESQMKQLFQNLITNAIKFHKDKSPQVHLSAEDKNKEWVFSVADNGIGIDPKYADRIFEVFKRLHTRRKYSGTGIGLAISRKIVERHGGHIWVDSKPGEGSTFYFTIPKGGS